jgi:hypothetical protein
MELILRLSISEARARLPELAQLVMAAPGRAIIIEHRDFQERLVLTTESSIEALETKVENAANEPGVFKLAGSISSDLTDDELEAAMIAVRRKWSEEAARRIASFERD